MMRSLRLGIFIVFLSALAPVWADTGQTPTEPVATEAQTGIETQTSAETSSVESGSTAESTTETMATEAADSSESTETSNTESTETAAATEEAAKLDSGDTAWMLTATALVLFMTIPGLSLFYAGLVRSKNVLSVLMQCFAITSLMTILWLAVGYSLAFTEGPLNPLVGGLSKAFLKGVGVDTLSGTIPETVFFTFQMTFAIITPALMVGAFAERMKFSSLLIFMSLWLVVVYAPICHWVWGGGWLSQFGILDFAGGTVVHINAGIAGLIVAMVIGQRKGYNKNPIPPHNLTLAVIGASILWVGWFGFNAGSELAADNTAGMALAVTQIATAAAALAWMFTEWLSHGKPSVLGIITGAVGGLVAITPAAGAVGPLGALVIGFSAGIACFWGATSLKRILGYDDSLDVFGVHGIGGIVGAVLTGVFAATSLGGAGFGEGNNDIAAQVTAQLIGVGSTILYTAAVSFVLIKFVDLLIGIRVDEDQESVGLDISLHSETGYNLEGGGYSNSPSSDADIPGELHPATESR